MGLSTQISTHILDTQRGRPVADVAIVLRQQRGEVWVEVGRGVTDADGRCRALLGDLLLGDLPLEAGPYELTFLTAPYFDAQGVQSLYPRVTIVFTVADPAQHYHVPLLLAANGYTTYRGS